MEFEGDMLDALDFKPTADGIEIGFWGKEAWKADGHLKFSGATNNTPQRRFLPGEGQEFDSSIQSEIEKIITDAIAEEMEFTSETFDAVNTKAELYDALADFFPDFSRADIRASVVRIPSLMRLLDDMDLLDLL